MNGKDKNIKIVLLLAVVVHAALVVAGVYWRFVDGDEGGMLVTAREVINGRVPILDINAHNQPLLYYFYGAWMKAFGFSIVSGRFLSAIAMFSTGLLFIWAAKRFTEDWTATLLLYLLYITNLTFFKTNLPVKPFALSNLFNFAAFAALAGAYIRDRRFGYGVLIISGVCLGVSMGMRLIFILPFVFACWLVYVMLRERSPIKEIVKNLSVFTVATTVPILPAIWLFLKEPERAYAIWAGIYAQIYLGRGNNPDFLVDVNGAAKYAMIRKGLYEIVTVPDNSFLIIVLLASLVVFFYTRKTRMIDAVRGRVYLFSALIFLAVIWVYANLYGNYLGYVNQLVLFAIFLCAPLAMTVSRRLGLKKLVIAGGAVSVAAILLFYWHYQQKLRTSIFYMFGSKDVIITPAYVTKESEDIVKRFTKEGDVVLDNWGMFVFESGRRPVRGFEYPTDSALFWQLMTDKTKAGKYLFTPEPLLFGMIERKEIPLIILGDGTELEKLLGLGYSPYPLRDVTERYYDLYKKQFVKPTNAWVLFYLPKKNAAGVRKER
ncbi:MAG: hypothetical protein HY884_05670 [Deltaproteobacteria bacterium]|nr:hypothetical protein [Deltaproteobacteria bacterium]